MKLVEVKITNFRGYANETCVAVDPLTVLIGKNDAGKFNSSRCSRYFLQ